MNAPLSISGAMDIPQERKQPPRKFNPGDKVKFAEHAEMYFRSFGEAICGKIVGVELGKNLRQEDAKEHGYDCPIFTTGWLYHIKPDLIEGPDMPPCHEALVPEGYLELVERRPEPQQPPQPSAAPDIVDSMKRRINELKEDILCERREKMAILASRETLLEYLKAVASGRWLDWARKNGCLTTLVENRAMCAKIVLKMAQITYDEAMSSITKQATRPENVIKAESKVLADDCGAVEFALRRSERGSVDRSKD